MTNSLDSSPGHTFFLSSRRNNKSHFRKVACLCLVGALLITLQFRSVAVFVVSNAYRHYHDHDSSTLKARQHAIISTFASAPRDGSRLVNGPYHLRINEYGVLVLEQTNYGSPTMITVWRADLYAFYFQNDWEKMLLILREDGLLMLVQEVGGLRRRKCEPVGTLVDDGTFCRVVVWTSGVSGTDFNNYILKLSDNGVLQVEDTETHGILWSSHAVADENEENEDKPGKETPVESQHIAPDTLRIDPANKMVVSASDVKVAWLMSFPNSGTSYTLHAVRRTGRTIVATNYGKETASWDANGQSMPVYDSEMSGPFWIGPLDSDYSLPSNYVLTKTHCGGYCMNCNASRAVENLDSFLLNCRSGIRHFINKNGISRQALVTYNADLVQKAVHLFRNPFDNIFARFHHYVANFDPGLPVSREGFLSCCQLADEMFGSTHEIAPYMDPVALEALENVPCRSDFFRYAQWHNLAFETTHHLAIPTHVLYYESYSTHFNETLSELLDFLDQEWRGAPPDFISGKVYSQLYTQEELDSVKVAMKAMCSPVTWSHIQRYFA